MLKNISLILPNYNSQDARAIDFWLKTVPELNLVAPLQTVSVSWKEKVCGSTKDWLAIADTIKANWNKSAGFVVWAPESSLLQVAGTLFLIFGNSAKPIIVFSAPDPAIVSRRKFAQLSLKSVLVNAAFVAQGELGEVLVLSDQKLYRPPGCFWGFEQGQAVVNSSFEPIASIDFSLTINESFTKTKKMPVVKGQQSLENNFEIMHLFPGLQQVKPWPSQNKVSLVITNSAYWGHPDVQALRDQLAKEGLATIWFSKLPWPDVKTKKDELVISHPQTWWATLATQYHLAKKKEPLQAFKALEKTFNV